MKISGFTFCKDAESLYYPIVESIKSILPIVDEYVVALGVSTDDTKNLIQTINSPKLKIIHTKWDLGLYKNGTVHAQQTDFAKSKCEGEWLIYLQADEVIHENDHQKIIDACAAHLNNPEIEGFLFDFKHFWGDYDHYQEGHSWYDKEIRIIRNRPDIHSWQSAQSFRSIPNFDGVSYRKKEGSRKLNVAELGATVYHYGWVRPPEIMAKKVNKIYEIHTGTKQRMDYAFGWGNLQKLSVYRESHPSVMKNRITAMNWTVNQGNEPEFMRHNRLSSKLLSYVEKNLFGGQKLFGHHNYKIIMQSK